MILFVVIGLAGCTQQNFPLSSTEECEYQGHELNSIYDIR